jgi:hypothetical protein
MRRLAITLLLLPCFCLASATAQDEKPFALHKLLVSAKLPEGYQATEQPLKAGKKSVGFMILVKKPNETATIDILIESRAITTAPARRAAAKAYVNVAAAALAKQGYKVVEQKLPDITKETFEKPLAIDLVFADAKGKKLWTHQEIFFTDNEGIVAKVSARDADTLANLIKWAKTIRAKTKQDD